MRTVPRLCIKLGPGICLTTEEIHGNTSVRATEKCSAYQRRARFVSSTWLSTGLPEPVAFGPHFRAAGQTLGQSRYLPSFADLSVSPLQLTLSRSSQSGL